MTWTTSHQALLNAFEASAIVPPLFFAATNGLLAPEAHDVQRLRDWPQSLFESPCAQTIRNIQRDSASRAQLWEPAFAKGLCDRAAHHTGLVFFELADRLVDARHFDDALDLIRLGSRAWAQVLSSTYFETLYDALGGAQTSLTLDHLRGALFDERCDALDNLARRALHGDATSFDATMLAFVRSAYVAHGHHLPTPFGTRLKSWETMVAAQISRLLDEGTRDLDLGVSPPEAILAPYSEAVRKAVAAGMPDALAEHLATEIIEALWTLRRVKRDDAEVFNQLIDHAFEVAHFLEQALRDGRSIGFNARCADIFSFRAERERGDARLPYLQRALDVCPGHRNASMLHSHIMLGRANLALAVAETALTAKSGRTALREARGHLDEAARIFSANKDLPDYEERFVKACVKHGLSPGEVYRGE